MKTNLRLENQQIINKTFSPKNDKGAFSIKKIAGLLLGGAVAWLLASIGNTVIFGSQNLFDKIFTKQSSEDSEQNKKISVIIKEYSPLPGRFHEKDFIPITLSK